MAGDNPKPPSTATNKRPPPPSSSSSQRKSRWQSSPSTTTPTTTNPSSSNTKPSTTSRQSSDKPTPKRGPNPSPQSHPSYSFSDPPPFPSSLGPPPPPPPPSYGFHMLDRRTIVLADGSVRSYFALPPDYQDFTPPPRVPMGRFAPPPPVGPLSPDGFRGRGDHDHQFGSNSNPMKRKFGFGEERERERERERDVDEFARQKQQLLQFGNAGPNPGLGTSSSPFRARDEEYRNSKFMRVGDRSNNVVGLRQDVVRIDPPVMKKFLHFVKLINENPNQRKNYLENGKFGPLRCLACDRSSKDFPDVHALIMHTYNSDNADLRVDHLGLHKALCAVMGWSFMRPPDSSRAYQHMPAEEAAAYQDDLIMWPPMVIINNTNTGKGKDGRMEGLGNKAMDSKLRDLGFVDGKSKSLYSREGHLGITLIKFASDQSGLKEAMRLADHFEKDHHGRRDWAHVQSTAADKNEESNPDLVMVDQRTGERRRILYGYLATAFDLDKVDYETRKKVVIESKFEKLQPSK